MPLRFLLFTSDEGTARPVCQVLTELGVEGEPCSDALIAVEKVTNQIFHIVVIDWDKQPEAGLLLATARGKKAAERPLTLALVSDDASIPKALQAGANSILHKPIQVNLIRDTLTTARDLLRAQQPEVAPATSPAAATPPSSLPSLDSPPSLRAGEFLQSTPVSPGGQFVTESQVPPNLEQPEPEPVDPLKELEPVAGAVAEKTASADNPSEPEEAKGLQWYLKTKVGKNSPAAVDSTVPKPSGNPELMGFDQMSSAPSRSPSEASAPEVAAAPAIPHPQSTGEQNPEEKLFAYIDGKASEPEEPRPGSKIGKGAIAAAVALAICAITAAPQAPWHPQLRTLFTHSRQSVHNWLNPQPAAPAQAPATHEEFVTRAGDEYKLPVAENIPDATTDPSQIQVLPVVDPTLKKPNNEGPNAGQPLGQGDVPGTNPAGMNAGGTNSGVQGVGEQPGQPSGNAQPETPPVVSAVPVSAPAPASDQQRPHSNPIIPQSLTTPQPPAPPPLPAPARTPQLQPVSGNVPSSLKSQMASMTPDAGGNKAPEAALPSIEPVSISEAAARGLLADQPNIAYPENAKGQQGTVVIQLLIGRDGTVQDAKFLQGSLVFARAAIEGVKLWKFKPYMMNGRPVSVQTPLTLAFKRTP